MSKEWYILEYESKDYLHNKTLVYRPFPFGYMNHDHCELCWARFSKYKEDLQSGYFERESNSWICEECYENFKNLFRWIDEKTMDDSPP